MHDPDREAAFGELVAFRQEFYECLTARADVLFELTDALLCAEGAVRSLAGLSLSPEHRRGHGALYGAINQGSLEADRVRNSVAAQRLPRAADGRIVLAVDVSPWLRPNASTSRQRSFGTAQDLVDTRG